ncbi:hypothetical protein OG407_24035 [Streptomyces sp. NBC_01515]|uniref:hypothetical protein n=1 Tax=Streptomyces sp. NBC_01515 TaxID=2903890 RepID=UPI00386810F6
MPDSESARESRQKILDVLIECRDVLKRRGADTSEMDVTIEETREFVRTGIRPASFIARQQATVDAVKHRYG